ncbi:AI-2E family transporter [Halobacteriales archaeon Cl-PHB]
MPADRRRRLVLAGLFGLLALLGMYLLQRVLGTVFFAITVAYVLYPLRKWIVDRGLGKRIAAGICTLMAFLAAIAILTPLMAVVYYRRNALFSFARQFPQTFAIEISDTVYTLDFEVLLVESQDVLQNVAVDLAQAMPVLGLKLFLFAILVYGLLLTPHRLRTALLGPVPAGYHDLVDAFHERTKSILFAIYVLQAATAAGTFVIGYGVFWALGYDQAFVFAVLSGVLQFIPILGPSIVIVAIAGADLLAGNTAAAITVLGFGLLLVGFLPDAVIRPRLAQWTSGIPGSLYFVGFVGGVLSVGAVGVIAGPVVVALLAESVEQLSTENHSTQQQLE